MAGSDSTSSYTQQVPAVDQATRILYHLAEAPAGQTNLTAICSAVGIHKSKGSALLNTLQTANLVTRDEATKTYTLGRGLLTLSRSVLDSTDLTRATEPLLAELARNTECTAFLGLVMEEQVFVVARQEAPLGMSINIRVGHRYPLTWGAHGKALVAFMPAEKREAALARPALYFHSKTVLGEREDKEDYLDTVRKELQEARRRGYATDLGGVQTGMNAVGAPVLTSDGRPLACVAVVGTFPAESAPTYGRAVARVTDRVSARLDPHLRETG